MGIPICVMKEDLHMAAMVQEYDAKLDSRRRITIRNTPYEYYHVEEYEDGIIKLAPRELTVPFQISKNTLQMMDSAIENFNKGVVSEEVDLSEFEGISDV